MLEEVYSIMVRIGISMVVGALFTVGAPAQSQTGAAAQASGQASVQAGNTQAQAGASSSTSAAATAQHGQANAGLANGTAFNAALSCPVDSKKCKPGDAVNARTTEAIKSEGKMVIPKGSKLVGHVTEASARGNGETESALGIVFDKAILKNGQEIPLNVAIQALASAQGGPSMAGRACCWSRKHKLAGRASRNALPRASRIPNPRRGRSGTILKNRNQGSS